LSSKPNSADTASRRGGIVFALLVACGVVFIWLTSSWLPATVASHFQGDGSANGFMQRASYIRFMLTFVLGLPLLLAAVSRFAFGNPDARINLPNRQYWLAPERRDETVSYLRRHLTRFNSVLVVFLCYVHWLVVRANQVQPPHLSSPGMLGGLGAFGVFTIVWTRSLLRRFRNAPAMRSEGRGA
jgi:hypothetical protein